MPHQGKYIVSRPALNVGADVSCAIISVGMKKQLALILALLFATSTLYARNKSHQETIKFLGRTRTYDLFVPEIISADKPAPLLLLLHGSGGRGLMMIDLWKGLAAKEGLVLVAPDSKERASWNLNDDGPDFLHAIIEAVRVNYPIDPRRIYMFGHSGGGAFALYVAMLQSEYFAAAAVHAGAIRPQDYSVIDEASRRIPIAVWIGTSDPFFPVYTVREMGNAMSKRGITLEVIELPGQGHNYYAATERINRDVWDFLQRQALSSDPRYIAHAP